MNQFTRRIGVAVRLCGAILLAGWMYAEMRTRARWDRKAAARYLDRREKYLGRVARSCARPRDVLRFLPHSPAVRLRTPGAPIRSCRSSAGRSRASSPRQRSEARPALDRDPRYYPSMAAQSRGTESVLNALILAGHDALAGKFSPDGRAAFAHMWDQQLTTGNRKGSWAWILFDNEPWEAADSPYYGACLAAIAVGIAPENYSSDPAIKPNIAALNDYLRRESSAQSPIQRVNLLWASIQLPGLLTSAQQQAIVDEILARQHTDGGWSLSELSAGWQREDGTPQIKDSDGYATGFIALVLQQLGYSRDDAHVKTALNWLVQNQSLLTGGWPAYSLNKRRHNPFSEVSTIHERLSHRLRRSRAHRSREPLQERDGSAKLQRCRARDPHREVNSVVLKLTFCAALPVRPASAASRSRAAAKARDPRALCLRSGTSGSSRSHYRRSEFAAPESCIAGTAACIPVNRHVFPERSHLLRKFLASLRAQPVYPHLQRRSRRIVKLFPLFRRHLVGMLNRGKFRCV